MIVVCLRKGGLDLQATWERLETLGVPVVGFKQTNCRVFTAETGFGWTPASTTRRIVAMFRAHGSLGRTQSILVVQPPPASHALDRSAVERAVAHAQAEATKAGVTGREVTPYLLAAVTRLTGGSSLDANLMLLERNSEVAGEIATICCAGGRGFLPARY
jgi:pseudouridine-5'-phosphate glycosidase